MDDKQLDRLLQKAAPPQPDAALMGRIMADFDAAQTKVSWRNLGQIFWPFGPVWQPLTAFALVAVMGLGLAPELMPTRQITDQGTQFASASFNTLVLGTGFDPAIELGGTP